MTAGATVLKQGVNSQVGRFGRDFSERKVSDLAAGELDQWLRSAGITIWFPNACRHSFASYCLALFRDPRELALEMGHTRSEITFRHYRELVKPSEAEKFWRIVPAIDSGQQIHAIG